MDCLSTDTILFLEAVLQFYSYTSCMLLHTVRKREVEGLFTSIVRKQNMCHTRAFSANNTLIAFRPRSHSVNRATVW